jgi:hypothetical protein
VLGKIKTRISGDKKEQNHAAIGYIARIAKPPTLARDNSKPEANKP